jgi:hypothetical protein
MLYSRHIQNGYRSHPTFCVNWMGDLSSGTLRNKATAEWRWQLWNSSAVQNETSLTYWHGAWNLDTKLSQSCQIWWTQVPTVCDVANNTEGVGGEIAALYQICIWDKHGRKHNGSQYQNTARNIVVMEEKSEVKRTNCQYAIVGQCCFETDGAERWYEVGTVNTGLDIQTAYE